RAPRAHARADPSSRRRACHLKVKVEENRELMGEGGGQDVARHPGLCLAGVGSGGEKAGEAAAGGGGLRTGAVPEYQPIATGQTWTATLTGLDLPELTVQTIA